MAPLTFRLIEFVTYSVESFFGGTSSQPPPPPLLTGSEVCVFVWNFLFSPWSCVLGNKEMGKPRESNGLIDNSPCTHSLLCEGHSAAPLTGNVGGSSRKPCRGVTCENERKEIDHIRADVSASGRKQSYAQTPPTPPVEDLCQHKGLIALIPRSRWRHDFKK